MGFLASGRRFVAGALLAGLAGVVAGCQSGNPLGVLNVGSAPPPNEDQIAIEELRAFCPTVALRDASATMTSYERGGDNDPARIVYRAALSEGTRSCNFSTALMGMNVAVAGRIVPGPRGTTGTVTLPIRVTVIDRSSTVYSQLHNFQVQVADTAGATQFIFSDNAVQFPVPRSRNVQVFVGFEQPGRR